MARRAGRAVVVVERRWQNDVGSDRDGKSHYQECGRRLAAIGSQRMGGLRHGAASLPVKAITNESRSNGKGPRPQ